MNVEEGVELARFTTLGTGGPARAFARPESELLQWKQFRCPPECRIRRFNISPTHALATSRRHDERLDDGAAALVGGGNRRGLRHRRMLEAD